LKEIFSCDLNEIHQFKVFRDSRILISALDDSRGSGGVGSWGSMSICSWSSSQELSTTEAVSQARAAVDGLELLTTITDGSERSLVGKAWGADGSSSGVCNWGMGGVGGGGVGGGGVSGGSIGSSGESRSGIGELLGNGEDSWGSGLDDWARGSVGDGSALGSVQWSSDSTGNGGGLLDGGSGVGLDLLGDLWSWVLNLGNLVDIVGVDLWWWGFLSGKDDSEDGDKDGNLGKHDDLIWFLFRNTTKGYFVS
jgi:hypothetical protein